MGWEQRGTNRYYYRKKREGSKVKSVYVGRGEIAQMVAQFQEISTIVERLTRSQTIESFEIQKSEAALSIMSRLTYFLLMLVVGTIAISVVRHPKPIPTATANQGKRDDYKKIKERFPTTDYDGEPDLPDPEKNAKRKEKQKRFNEGALVFSKVEPGVEEAPLFLEPPFTFPALPVGESEIVVVGTVGTAQAHLSENKRNVFTEFTLTVEDVLKSKIQGVAQGAVLTIDRIGGYVKYPNGQRVLYRIVDLNMPQVGGRYLVFLTAKHNKNDLLILTAYELTPTGTIPLDDLDQSTSLAGLSETDILQKVRNLIQNSAN